MTRRPDTPTVIRINRYRATPAPRTDGALALAREPAPAGSVPGRPLRLVRPGDDAEAEMRKAAKTALRMVAEAIVGARPPARLSLIALPEVCRELAAHSAVRPGLQVVRPQILRTWLQSPGPTVVETGAVVLLEGRAHLLSLRLEHLRGRWSCTAIEATVD